MKPIIAKAVIGALGAGTIGTGVFFATYSKEDNSYEKYLNEKGRKVLSQDSGKWADLINKYKEEGDGLLISINEKNIEKTALTEDQLKSWCNDNVKKEFTNTKDPIYQRVSSWCTEPTTIEKQIGTGKKILDDEEPKGSDVNNKDEQTWKQKETDYKLAENTDLINEISDNNEGKVITTKTEITTAKLRAWCKHSKSKNFKHEEEKRYLTYLKWCTK